MRIAIIGAGVAGLACAQALVGFGHAVVVFERSKAPGGRVATRRTEVGDFDHGAQYLTARTPAFIAQVESWSRAGIVAFWPVDIQRLTEHGDESSLPASGDSAASRWVGIPGMSGIGAAMAGDLDVRYGHAIVSIEASTAPGWSLQRRDGDGGDRVVVEGSFDGVVAAVPGPSAVALLSPSPRLSRLAADAHFEPCWALLVGFAAPLAIDAARVADAAFVDGGPLAWIARESSKPDRRFGERWTLHARSAWSAAHLDDDRETLKTEMLCAFREATGTNEQPVYSAIHRWGHARACAPLTDASLWDADLRLGACGDWCGGDRIEDAWVSGTALAAAIDRGG